MTHLEVPMYQLLSQRLSHVIIKKFNDTQTFSILQLKNLSCRGLVSNKAILLCYLVFSGIIQHMTVFYP